MNRIARVDELEVGAHDGELAPQCVGQHAVAALQAPGRQEPVWAPEDVLASLEPGRGHQGR